MKTHVRAQISHHSCIEVLMPNGPADGTGTILVFLKKSCIHICTALVSLVAVFDCNSVAVDLVVVVLELVDMVSTAILCNRFQTKQFLHWRTGC